jgi:hypothetical protein
MNLIIPSALDQDVRHPQREGAVGSGPYAQPYVGLVGKSDVTRIDDN